MLYYITYIIYTRKLKLPFRDGKGEQGRFRGSTGLGEQEGALWGSERAREIVGQ